LFISDRNNLIVEIMCNPLIEDKGIAAIRDASHSQFLVI